MSKFILGMTGAFGSGCSFIAREFIVPEGFKYLCLSDYLRRSCIEEKGVPNPDRKLMQDYGNEIRSTKGAGILAEMAISEIEADTEHELFVVDSYRNPGEIDVFRKKYPDFFLIGIFADYNNRWERVKEKYKNNNVEFDADEKRDKGEGEGQTGQRVSDCFFNADLVLSNNDEIHQKNGAYRLMKEKVLKYLNLFRRPGSGLPNDDEAVMAMAYSNGLRSNCLKRKVGAIIIDQFGNSFSSGYNEVPVGEDFCIEKYGECYRNFEKKNIHSHLAQYLTEPEHIKSAMSKFKILDLCRSLHAEENAIINIARFGSSSALFGATLYTTTYPCNLCANKIAQVGIKKMIYFEPYPVKQAKETLDQQEVVQIPFEGITFRSFFRVYRQCS